jgi:uncharacterized protein YodC (DUF2158 family)
VSEGFEVGDVVQLKSGGPPMPVVGIGSTVKDAHAKLRSAGIDLARYSADQLQAIEEAAEGHSGAGRSRGLISCTWFARDIAEHGSFAPEALNPIT